MSRPITAENAATVQAWCRQHDWGRQAQVATINGRMIMCYLIDTSSNEAGNAWISKLVRFDDIDELRAWAGY